MKLRWIVFAFFHLFFGYLIAEENFVLIDGKSSEKVLEMGSHLLEESNVMNF